MTGTSINDGSLGVSRAWVITSGALLFLAMIFWLSTAPMDSGPQERSLTKFQLEQYAGRRNERFVTGPRLLGTNVEHPPQDNLEHTVQPELGTTTTDMVMGHLSSLAVDNLKLVLSARGGDEGPVEDAIMKLMLPQRWTASSLAGAIQQLAGLVGPTTYSAKARRRIMAASMLAAKRSNLESAEEVEEAISGLLSTLRAAYHASTKKKSGANAGRLPLFLLHMSKAGGTSICNLARDNGCKTDPKANNCWPPGNGPVWFASFTHRETKCLRYQQMFAEFGSDILANEAYLDGGDGAMVDSLCRDFLYLTMLREPFSRVVSHFQQAGVKPAGYSRDEYAGTCPSAHCALGLRAVESSPY